MKVLTAEKAFLCLSMFNIVRQSMALFFPATLITWGETMVSIKRIQEFLLMEEKEKSGCYHEEKCKMGVMGKKRVRREGLKGGVSLHQVKGRWSTEEEDTLSDITMEVS